MQNVYPCALLWPGLGGTLARRRCECQNYRRTCFVYKIVDRGAFVWHLQLSKQTQQKMHWPHHDNVSHRFCSHFFSDRVGTQFPTRPGPGPSQEPAPGPGREPAPGPTLGAGRPGGLNTMIPLVGDSSCLGNPRTLHQFQEMPKIALANPAMVVTCANFWRAAFRNQRR